jgi:hypothetical protein
MMAMSAELFDAMFPLPAITASCEQPNRYKESINNKPKRGKFGKQIPVEQEGPKNRNLNRIEPRGGDAREDRRNQRQRSRRKRKRGWRSGVAGEKYDGGEVDGRWTRRRGEPDERGLLGNDGRSDRGKPTTGIGVRAQTGRVLGSKHVVFVFSKYSHEIN